MTKQISVALKAHLESGSTSLATCWLVERSDGQVFSFTDHDVDIPFGGRIYAAATGYTPTAADTTAGLNVDDLEIEGVLDSESITTEDLLAGIWDKAEVWVFMVNWADPSMGDLKLRRGTIGRVTAKRGTFVAEMRGLAQRLQASRGRVIRAGCDANFGDSRCGLSLATFTTAGVVSVSSGNRVFTVAAALSASYQFGNIIWTSGANVGLSMEIRETDPGTSTVELLLPMGRPIADGDAFTASEGCSKAFSRCVELDNVVNFRGFPHVPQLDKVAAAVEEQVTPAPTINTILAAPSP